MAFFKRWKKAEGNEETKIAQGIMELENVMTEFTKKTGVDLRKGVARVAVVMDHSGSMDDKYDNGTVQEVLNAIFPFAIKFDDDGQMEVFIFDDVCCKIEKNMNSENYEDYVKEYIIRKRYPYGGTRYAPAIEMTDKYYNDEESKTTPTIIFFITDGGNYRNDRTPSDKVIIESSEHGIFYMFIGVGKDDFEYLCHLDDLEGRKYDNTGFMKFTDFKNISNVEMFKNALKDYIPWLKAKGYVR